MYQYFNYSDALSQLQFEWAISQSNFFHFLQSPFAILTTVILLPFSRNFRGSSAFIIPPPGKKSPFSKVIAESVALNSGSEKICLLSSSELRAF